MCWSAIVLALTPCSMFESPNRCLWHVTRACQRVCPAVRCSIASTMVPAAQTEKGIPSQQIIRLCLQLLFRRILLRVTDNHLQLRSAHSLLPLASAFFCSSIMHSSTTVSHEYGTNLLPGLPVPVQVLVHFTTKTSRADRKEPKKRKRLQVPDFFFMIFDKFDNKNQSTST